MGQKVKSKGVLIVVLCLGVCLVIGATALGNAINNHTHNDPYCESLDFGGDECMVEVHIYNDTGSTHTVKQCSGSFRTALCKAFANSFILAPGTTQKVNGTTERDLPQPWLVLDQHGSMTGCLNLEFTKYVHRPITVPLSKLTSCKSFL